MKKIIILFFIVLISTSSISQEFSLSYDHNAILVKDLGVSVKFYTEIFKLKEISHSIPNPLIRWFSLNNNQQLHIIEGAVELKQHKPIHLALAVTNLKAFITHLKAKNIPFEDWPGTPQTISDRPDGVRQVYVQDPDGYWIEINDATY
ncbi:MAG: VOC family protein [Flavobacteriaceae bacterium]|nr:VOC family protein [Flavobacteriaceae bacterium]